MCIGIYLKPGKDISNEIIKNCFSSNSDGAGVMWKPTKHSAVYIRKGFMDVDSFIEFYRTLPTNCERGLHFRIATSGRVSAECCHPFPVVEDVKQMTKSTDFVNMAMLHNGIISQCTPSTGMYGTVSDTMVFASKYLDAVRYDLDNPKIKAMLEDILGSSKVLILRKNKPAVMYGKWIEDKGVFYTNDSYDAASFLYGWRHMTPQQQDDFYKRCYTGKETSKPASSSKSSKSASFSNAYDDGYYDGYYSYSTANYKADISTYRISHPKMSNQKIIAAIEDELALYDAYLNDIVFEDKWNIKFTISMYGWLVTSILGCTITEED